MPLPTSSLRKQGPISRALSIGCGVWVPALRPLRGLGRDDEDVYLPLSSEVFSTGHTSNNESRTLRSRRALGSAARDPVRRAAEIRGRSRSGRHLLPARGGASRDAAQYGAGAGRLSRRSHARDLAHAARAAGLSASALLAASPDRRNL